MNEELQYIFGIGINLFLSVNSINEPLSRIFGEKISQCLQFVEQMCLQMCLSFRL